MTIRLAATEDVLEPGRVLSLRPAARAIYVRRGTVEVAGLGTIEADDCRLVVGAATLRGEAEVWCFEAAAAWDEADHDRIVLARLLPRDPEAPLVLRADRVDFPAGGVTPRHGHAGPGIRRLLHGRLSAEIGAEAFRIDPGRAWFEAGPDPVVGRNLAPASAFVRGMALDVTLHGQPTYRPWDATEAAKPRGVAPRLFFDEIVTLPKVTA
jgi:quercetin dioxygenase-like cupin family protein